MTHPFMPKCAMLNGIQISATSIADPARFICKDILKQSSLWLVVEIRCRFTRQLVVAGVFWGDRPATGRWQNKGTKSTFVQSGTFTEQIHP